MKNILLVANWDSNVGFAWWLMENFWVTISDEYSKRGFKVFLIYPSISILPEAIKNSDIITLEHDFSVCTFNNSKKLIGLIKKNQIKYIYLTDRPAINSYYCFLRLFGIKKIIVHDHTPGVRSRITGLNKLIKYLVYRLPCINADHLIAVTPFVRKRFLETLIWPKSKCSIANNGIIPVEINPDFRFYAHTQFNIPRDAKIVITTGRASYYKKIDFIIECAKYIINGNGIQNLYFIHCGDGPDLLYFKNLVKAYGLSDNFIFAGRRNDIHNLLQSADIGIQASQGEVGYSLSILEYMSAGLATLVPDNPSVNQATEHDIDGYIFPENDVPAASKIIINLLLDDAKLQSIGRNARGRVENNFNLARTNDELLDAIGKVIIS